MPKYFTDKLHVYTANRDMFKVNHENARKFVTLVQS